MTPLHGRIIDAWMQHPTRRLRSEPIFESLRRWVPTTAIASSESVPLAATIEAMDVTGVRLGLVCAWWSPRGPLIDNDEVAAFVQESMNLDEGTAADFLYEHAARVFNLGDG